MLRELLSGSRRFNDLRRGVPLMSQSMLAQRLRELEGAGIVERRPAAGGRGWEYHLTPAGHELRPVVEQLGVWGYRWTRAEITRDELDPGLLLWDMQRRIVVERLPARRTVVEFYFDGPVRGHRRWWLVLNRGEVDLCLKHPGFAVDLQVRTTMRTMIMVWMGDLSSDEALRSGDLRVEGPPALAARFPSWLGLSLFAGVGLHPCSVRPQPRPAERGQKAHGA